MNSKGYLTEHQSLAGLATESYVNTQIAAIPTPDVSGQINTHNTATDSHNDIRLLVEGLTTRVNTLANSDDTTLDQMSEVVAYIKNNKSLIEGITNNKVNVSDIIDNLTTNVSNKPLSAAQGVALKALIDAIPSWAKADTKPVYTASEVGADTSGTANSLINTHNNSTTAHNDIRTLIDNVDKKLYSQDNAPTNPTVGTLWLDTNDNSIYTNVYIPERGVDYWTQADQESIVQQVISALGTPVFGRVDENNNIILTGNLANGTYTIKYEDAEGNMTVIGTLEQGASYKNWADPTSADWLNGQRLSTTGEIKPEVSELSNYIPVTAGQVVRVRGQNLFFHGTGTGYATQGFYNSEKVFIGKLTNPGSNPKDIYGTTWGADNEPVGDFVYTVPTAATFVSNYTADDIAFMRFSGRLCSGYTKEDIIITVDQEITD